MLQDPQPLTESEGTLRPMLRLALPVLAEQILLMLVGFSDTVLTGRYLDHEHLAAISLMVYLIWMLTNVFAVIGIGSTAMTARFVGAKDFAMARRVLHQAYLLGAMLALATAIVGIVFRSELVALMQLDGRAAALASRYLVFVFPVLPALMLQSVGIACLRGAGDMMTGLVTMIVVNAVNLAIAWSLVLGIGPLPKLGWDGIAIGTSCGYLVGGAMVSIRLLRGRYGLKLRWSELTPDRDLMYRLLRVGLPAGADVAMVVICQLWFLAIINQLGAVAAAAHGVAIRIESLGYLPGAAFHYAAATLTGQYLGAGNVKKAARGVLMACLTGGGTMVVAGVLLFLFAEPLTRLFVRPSEVAVIALTPKLLRIVAFAMPPLALQMILTGALRGAGDTRWPLAFTMTGYLGVRIPATYLLAHHWHWGVPGAWYAMLADLTVRAALTVGRFSQGGWKRVRV